MRHYHTLPLKGHPKGERSDCEYRYKHIFDDYGDVKGDTLIDICCASGYFLFKFVQDGGWLAYGVEEDSSTVDYINKTAMEEDMLVRAGTKLDGKEYDVGIYLDTHYHGSTVEDGYLEFLKDNVGVAYISCCRGGRDTNFVNLLKSMWGEVKYICDSKAGRKVYRCE